MRYLLLLLGIALLGCSEKKPEYDQSIPAPTSATVASSHSSGFYSEPFNLSLRPQHDSLVVYYTLDGSYPDTSGIKYTGPIRIAENPVKPNPISQIPTTPMEGRWQLQQFIWQPPSEVPMATTVRYRAYNIYDDPVTPVFNHTYFVGAKHQHACKVVSIITERENLYDEEDGIFVPGVRYSPALWEESPDWWPPGNYRQTGKAWERGIHFAVFDEQGKAVVQQNAGVRINGQAISAFPQKSLRIVFRKAYGSKTMDYPVFKNHERNTYERILLRNSGNDCFSTLFRDVALQTHLQNMDIETQQYTPVILYINGEYWGMYNFRDRYDAHYFGYHFNLADTAYDLIEGYDGVADVGNKKAYNQLARLLKQADLSDPLVYDSVQQLLDISNYIDFNLIQTYFANTDWPNNNIKMWRPHRSDGKFRFLVFDLDFTSGYDMMGAKAVAEKDMIAHATAENSEDWVNAPNSTYWLRNLLQNETFRRQFVCRYLELAQTTFHPDSLNATIDHFETQYKPSVPQHIQRWGYPKDMETWQGQVAKFRAFVHKRPALFRQHLEQHLGMSLDSVCPSPIHNTP